MAARSSRRTRKRFDKADHDMPGIASRAEVVELRLALQRCAQGLEPGTEAVGAEVVEPGLLARLGDERVGSELEHRGHR